MNFPMYPEVKQVRSWYEKYDELVDFWKQNGHFEADPSNDFALHNWVDRQRARYRSGNPKSVPLSKLQVYLLERIGFTWASNRIEVEWQKNYEELVEFSETRGRLPRKSENRKLYTWMVVQRRRCKPDMIHTQSKLSEYQIQKLEDIGGILDK